MAPEITRKLPLIPRPLFLPLVQFTPRIRAPIITADDDIFVVLLLRPCAEQRRLPLSFDDVTPLDIRIVNVEGVRHVHPELCWGAGDW